MIVLIGMPGAGKSTVGKEISERSDYVHIDLDDYIESTYQKTLFDLIKEHGDDGFSEIENNSLDRILSEKKEAKIVLSTGGSACYCDCLDDSKKDLHWIVFLDESFETLRDRTENFSNRGIVFHGMTPRQLYESRCKLYLEKTNYRVDSRKKTPDILADEILRMTG